MGQRPLLFERRVFSSSKCAGAFLESVHDKESALNSLTRGHMGWWILLPVPLCPVKASQEAAELIQETFPAIVLNIMVSLSCSFQKSLFFAISLS